MRDHVLSTMVAAFGLTAAVVVLGCAGPSYASKEEVALAEARLLAPFQVERDVVADTLVIEISANFYGQVARPATNPRLHEMDLTTVDGDDVRHWSSRGGLQSPLRFRVGEVDFAVIKTATLRVLGSGKPMTLTVRAAGEVSEVRPGSAVKNWREIRIQEGAFRPR